MSFSIVGQIRRSGNTWAGSGIPNLPNFDIVEVEKTLGKDGKLRPSHPTPKQQPVETYPEMVISPPVPPLTVKHALQEFPTKTGREIAEMCAVSEFMVRSHRFCCDNIATETGYLIGKDGKQYKAHHAPKQQPVDPVPEMVISQPVPPLTVKHALQEFPGLSGRQIAEICAVSEITVRRFKNNFDIVEVEKTLGKDNKVYSAH